MAQRTGKEETEFKVPETLTLCINNCGVTGNPATNNMCQKCFNATTATSSSPTAATTSAGTSILKFSDNQSSRSTPSPSQESRTDSVPPTTPASTTNSRTTASNRSENEPAPSAEKKVFNRCSGCRKRVGLTGFRCVSGPLPGKIAEATERSGLVLLDLSHNHFSGKIPLRITELKSLEALFLSHNLLTGAIPERIGNLTYLQVIDLSHNSLSGSIPLDIVGCFQLLALILNNNNLSGEIQPELDALDSLKILDVSHNKISGEIPLTLAGLKSLEIVDFSSNGLSGTLNDAITKWSNLKYLSLAQNKFSGDLPSWLFTFEAIQMIDFSGNKFSGFIPDGNFNISFHNNKGNSDRADKEPFIPIRKAEIKISVMVVDSSELNFSYKVSSTIGIDLSDNLLQGEIPDVLFEVEGLEYLNLSYNFLDGQVPRLEKMWNLRALDLSHNSLSGQIPGNITTLKNLVLLNLSYNSFSGSVPVNQGYWKFPGAFAGNPGLCVASSGEECDGASLPTVPWKTFEEVEGPILVWVFCVSAFVSFYFGVVALFCSARARSYILQTKV